jgi:hypothetical protein
MTDDTDDLLCRLFADLAGICLFWFSSLLCLLCFSFISLFDSIYFMLIS